MAMTERNVQNLSFFGRLADDITREVIPSRLIQVSIDDLDTDPFYKKDGYFTFADIPPRTSDYLFHLSAATYRSRRVEKNLPNLSPVEITSHGEDELIVVITGFLSGSNTGVKFAKIPFLKTIPKNSAVVGQDGFEAVLTRDMEGEEIEEARLNSIAGLRVGEILRIRRGPNVIMRPGPYYSFEPGTTLIQLKFCENGAGEQPPVAGAKCVITDVNEIPVKDVMVGTVAVKTITPEGGEIKVLGTEKDITCYSDSRGKVVFYFVADTFIEKLKLEITAPGFLIPRPEIDVTPGELTFQSLPLTMA